MRALAVSPLGFLVGVALGAIGGGGSIVAVPVLVFAAGQSPSAATTTSLLVVGTAAAIGVVGHARAGRVRFAAGITIGLAGVGGSIVGSAVNRRLDGDVLLLAFGVLILVAAWRMVTACPSCTRVGEARALLAPDGGAGLALRHRIELVTVVEVVALGTAVGFLTGLFGVGGGFVIVPALTLVLGFNMPQAIGTSLLVVAINATTALAVRLDTTGVEWSVALPFTATAVVGVLVGKRIADRLDAGALVRWFALALVVLAALVMASAISGLLH